MQKEIPSKLVAITFGILAVSFLVAFYVVAWQEPSQNPPGGNVRPPGEKGLYGWVQISPLPCPNSGTRYPMNCSKLSPGTCNSYVIPDCEYVDGVMFDGTGYTAGCESGYQSIKTGAECATTGADCSGMDAIRSYSCYKSP